MAHLVSKWSYTYTAVNKALKAAELRVKLQAAQAAAAQAAKKASLETKSPLEKPYKGSSQSYSSANQVTPKKEKEGITCDLCHIHCREG